MPKITVVITAYKLEKHIAACLDGLFAQTEQDFSVLAVDDCSPDGTRAILAEYAARYPGRIDTLYLERNLGSPAKTRNAALESGRITGKYAVFLDGDDRLEPDFLETLLRRAEESGADIALCAYDRVEGDTGRMLCKELCWLPEAIPLPPVSDAPAMLNSALWNKLIRTECLQDLRLPDFRVGEDLCYCLALMQRANGVACVQKACIHYQIWKGSVMNTTRQADCFALAEELKRLYGQAEPAWQEVLALVSFLHIGLSMPLRMLANKGLDLRAHNRWTREYMRQTYGFYRNARYLSFRSLARRGAKGLAIWLCLAAYRCNAFLPLLRAYSAFAAVTRREIKF